MTKPRLVRFALVAAAMAVVVIPAVSRVLRAKDNPSAAAAAPPAPVPAPTPTSPPPSGPATPAPRPALGPATAPATQAVDPNHVIIQVGGESITAREFDAFISDLPPQDQSMARGPGRREVAEMLVRMKLLAKEAERRNLQDTPNVKRQLVLIRDQVMANAVMGNLQETIDDTAIAKYYNDHKAELERISARHILVRTPGSPVAVPPGKKELTEEQAKAKADDLYKQLKAGADFLKLARENSDDVGSAAEGGDLGSFTHGRMVAPFEQTAFSLKEGEFSQPVKTQFGWHIIQVTGRFDSPDRLAMQIRPLLTDQRMRELIDSLRKNNKVELDENFLGPALPEEPMLPGAPGANAR